MRLRQGPRVREVTLDDLGGPNAVTRGLVRGSRGQREGCVMMGAEVGLVSL